MSFMVYCLFKLYFTKKNVQIPILPSKCGNESPCDICAKRDEFMLARHRCYTGNITN